MMARFMQSGLLLIALCLVQQQLSAQVFIRLNQPTREQNNVNSARQYLSGRTCKGCRLTLNNESIYVYPTGAFAIKKDLPVGATVMALMATDSTGASFRKQVVYYYRPVPPPTPTPVFRIDYFNIYPEGNLQVSEGDTLRIRLKAFPGCKASWFHKVPLRELPAADNNGVGGFYEGSYVIQESDSLLSGRIRVSLQDADGQTTVKESPNYYTFLRNRGLFTGRTIDDLTYLTISPKGDRLGPQKLGYLDEGV